jgi:glutamate racemase
MSDEMQPKQPIGIFDSGIGGLSVLQAVQRELPHEDLIYMGDQGHVPYGPRSKTEIRDFSIGITKFLLSEGAKLIVVACNTASAASLHDLRERFPSVLFVGMEPAVKPAAESTRTGKVGVLATPMTFKGDLYASLVARYAQDMTIFQDTCPGLVTQIEAGQVDSPKTRAILVEALTPMLERGIDTVVLGCTHYPFVIPLIREIAGAGVNIIDPAPAVAQQTRRLLDRDGLLNSGEQTGDARFYTSGDPVVMTGLLIYLLGESTSAAKVDWQEDFSLRCSPQ